MNFKNIIRDEILEHKTTIRNLTTAAIIIYPELPSSGVQQTIHDRTKNLNIHNIFTTLAISGDDNGIRINISTYLISNTIRKVYLSKINTIFNKKNLESEEATFIIPEINRIPVNKTKF